MICPELPIQRDGDGARRRIGAVIRDVYMPVCVCVYTCHLKCYLSLP